MLNNENVAKRTAHAWRQTVGTASDCRREYRSLDHDTMGSLSATEPSCPREASLSNNVASDVSLCHVALSVTASANLDRMPR